MNSLMSVPVVPAPDIAIIFTNGLFFRIDEIVSMPSWTGINMSVMTMSTCCPARIFSPSFPFDADATLQPDSSNMEVTNFRTNGQSSITKTLSMMSPLSIC